MKYRVIQELEIRSEPSSLSGNGFGKLHPGFIVDAVKEVEDSITGDIWLKDNNGFFYNKNSTEEAFPIKSINYPALEFAASKIPSWNSGNFDVTRFWPYTTGRGIGVAVIDSGIYPHKDLIQAIDKGKTFIGSITDTNGHGTHVAGIIAARGVSDLYGVAPECTIIPIKASIAGTFTNKNLVNAINYATNIPEVRVINLSLKANTNDKPGIKQFETAIKEAINKGKIVVAASGNLPTIEMDAPAKFDNVIAVGAVYLDNKSIQETYLISSQSNYGNNARAIDISAPGLNINSCKNQNEGTIAKNGTSMATAFISGIIALKLQINPEMKANDILSAFSKSIFQYAQLAKNPEITIPVLDCNLFINN
jgi:subtilisin family serine protease